MFSKPATIRFDLSPKFEGELIRIRNNGWTCAGLLCESIDNSFQYGSTVVTIHIYCKDGEIVHIEILDDGSGDDNLIEHSRLGCIKKLREIGIGCYGRGLKEAGISLFNKKEYTTVYYEKGIKKKLKSKWDILIMCENDSFQPEFTDPIEAPSEDTGMSVKLKEPVNSIKSSEINNYSEVLAHRYENILRGSSRTIH